MTVLSDTAARLPNGKPTSSTTPPLLLKAAGNVRYLISYIAGEGKAVEETDYVNVLTALKKIDSLSPEEEAAFWKGYSSLVKDALPARVDALYYKDFVDAKSTSEKNHPEVQKILRQEETLSRIRKTSILAFVITLALFAYLSVTESAMHRNDLITTEYESLKAGYVKGTPIEKQYQAVKDEVEEKPTGAGGNGESKSPQFQPPSKQERLDDMISSRRATLVNLAGYNDDILRFLEFRWGSRKPVEQDGPVNGEIAVTQQSINALISKYFLPVFAALLGVTVYIMRSASADLKTLSFRTYESGIYSNRLALGVVGGIAISWFSVTDTSGIVGSITPAALAFLVGYSVEVLYNILDSLVKALGANEKT